MMNFVSPLSYTDLSEMVTLPVPPKDFLNIYSYPQRFLILTGTLLIGNQNRLEKEL